MACFLGFHCFGNRNSGDVVGVVGHDSLMMDATLLRHWTCGALDPPVVH